MSVTNKNSVPESQVLQAYWDAMVSVASRHSRMWPDEALRARTQRSRKLCWMAMGCAHSEGLVDFDVSLRDGWLTLKGVQALSDTMAPLTEPVEASGDPEPRRAFRAAPHAPRPDPR